MWRVLGNASLDEAAAAPRPQPQRRSSASGTSKSNSNTGQHAGSPAARPHAKPQPSGSSNANTIVICDGKYRITGVMRKGATGVLYSAVQLQPQSVWTPATPGQGPTPLDVVGHDDNDVGGGATAHRSNDGGDRAHRAGDGDGRKGGAATATGAVGPAVLKVEECAAPKRQMQNEWQVYRALEAQRVATQATRDPLPAPGVGGFPRAEFYTIDMPTLPSSLRGDTHGAGGATSGATGSGAVSTAGLEPTTAGDSLGRAVNVLAMERLGDNLMTLSQGCRGGRFSLQTTLRLGAQMVSLLRMLHCTGYVHRDIKPENFCVGRGKQLDRVFLIDYGLACRADHAAHPPAPPPAPSVTPPSTALSTAPSPAPNPIGLHKAPSRSPPPPPVVANTIGLPNASSSSSVDPPSSASAAVVPATAVTITSAAVGTGLVGSVRYLSVAAHAGARQTPRCDLESLGYVLVFLAKGKLPWQGLTARTREAHMEKIRKSKTEETPETLCKGLSALAEYLSYVRSLPQGEPADYGRAERIFTDGLRRRGFPPDAPFDWMNAHHPSAVAALAAAAAAAAAASTAASSVGANGGGCGSDGDGGLHGISAGVIGGGVERSVAKRPRLAVPGRGGIFDGGGKDNGSAIVREGSEGIARGGSGVGIGSVGVVGRGFVGLGGGRRFAAASAVMDLYADVPPPDEAAAATAANDIVGGDSSRWRRSSSLGGEADGAAPSGDNAAGESGGGVSLPSPESGNTGSKVAGRGGSQGIQDVSGRREVVTGDGKISRRSGKVFNNSDSVEPGAGVVNGSTTGVSQRGRLGSDGGEGNNDIDVRAALAKLRPHLRMRGAGGNKAGTSSTNKKLPRACALLGNLMSAKLTAENEGLFFEVLCDAVSGSDRPPSPGKSLSSAAAAAAAAAATVSARHGDKSAGRSPRPASDDSDVRERCDRRERAGLKADGAAGEAVRRLVAAACSKSAVFSGRRREEVEAWGRDCVELEAAAAAAAHSVP